MSITPYLGNEYFEPDIIANMSTAFANGCRALELYYHGDAAADLVAMKVIELARAGERDVDALTTKILEIFSTREF